MYMLCTRSIILGKLLPDSQFFISVHPQFSSVAKSCLTLCDPTTAASQASLSITSSRSLLKLMSIESVMPSNHLILCRPLLLLPSIFPNIRVFSNGKSNHNSKSETIASTCSSLPSNIPLSSWFITGPIQ